MFGVSCLCCVETLGYGLANVTCHCLPVQQLAFLADYLTCVHQELQDSSSKDDVEWLDGASLMKSLIAFSDSLGKDKRDAKVAALSAMKALLGVSLAAKEAALDSTLICALACSRRCYFYSCDINRWIS